MRTVSVASLALASLALVAPSLPAGAVSTGSPSAVVSVSDTTRSPARAGVPALEVTRVVNGLRLPWDVQPLGGGRLLMTERETARLLVAERDGSTRALAFPSNRVWVSGETGLMSLEVDPAFSRNRRIYTCQGGFREGGGNDVRVIAWTLDAGLTRARQARVLLGGIAATSGRHGGCRLLVLRDGSLLVGTGDAATSSNPRNLRSLAGKTLRLNRFNGKPWSSNPFVRSPHRNKRFVMTYGHRNVQGLAQRGDGSLWSVEHGSDRDDEVNKLVRGGDYGWQPGPGYDESSPMTDQSLPGRQREAKWRSGMPTIATSGATFVSGRKWGALNGTLAVAALGGQRMVFMRFDQRGNLVRTRTPAVLREFGRLRSVTRSPNGDLLVTTSNGENDSILRVSPR